MTDEAKREAQDDLFHDHELSVEALDRSADANGKARCVVMTILPCV